MNKQNIKIQKINALHLYNIENETLDKIVTDSPWGGNCRKKSRIYRLVK